MRRTFILSLVLGVALVTWLGLCLAQADQYRRGQGNGHGPQGYQARQHRRAGQGGLADATVPAVSDPIYAENCGGCHFAYQPALLPARCWQRLLAAPDDHFGQDLGLDPTQLAQLRAYALANAAETATGELSRQIAQCAWNGDAPRVSQLPVIQRFHRRLDAAAFARPAVGGPGNCPACHQDAAQGNYDRDRVSMPGDQSS